MILGNCNKFKSKIGFAFVFIFFLIVITSFTNYAHCASTWTKDGDGLWNNADNWSGGIPNAVEAVAIFPNTITVSPEIGLNLSPTVGTMQFTPKAATTDFTIKQLSTNALSLRGATPTISVLAAGKAYIEAPLNYTTSLNLTASVATASLGVEAISGTGTVTITGPGTVMFAAPSNYTGDTNIVSGKLTTMSVNAIPSTSAVTVSAGAVWQMTTGGQFIGSLAGGGNISMSTLDELKVGNNNNSTTYSGIISGAGYLTKAGTGTLTLSGSNVYTGGTNVSAGTLLTNTSPCLPTTGLVTVANGATLNLNNNDQTIGNLAGAGTVALGSAALTLGDGTDQTFSGVITGTGTLVKQNAGSLILSGNNQYTGTTTVNAGTLAITTNTNIGTGTSALILNATSILQANGTASITTHPITLGGSATINTNGNNFGISTVISGSGPLIKAGAGTLTLTGANTYTAGTTVSAGTLAIANDGNIGAGASVLTLNTGAILQANGAANLAVHPITLGGAAAIDTQANTFTISTIISGTGPLTKIGSGTLILNGVNTYTGGTNIFGTLQAGVALALPPTGVVTVSPGANFNLITFDQTIGNLAGSGAVNLGTATLTVGDTSNQTFSGIISGTGSLIKQNTGILTLTGNNLYTGTTRVNGGTLSITNDANIGVGPTILTLNTGATLQANGTAQLVAPGGHPINLLGAASIDTNGNSFLISTIISGTGPLTKKGTGTLTLSGPNTYVSPTIVNTGTLAITNDGNLGVGASLLDLNAGTTLQANGAAQLIGPGGHPIFLGGAVSIDTNGNSFLISTIISGSGPLTKIGTGTLTLSGANAYTSETIVNTDTLAITNDGNLGFGTSSLTLNAGAILQANGAANIAAHPITLGGAANIDTNGNPFSISTVISGSGPLTKIGAGTLTLSGNNVYTAGTTISTGTLQLGSSTAIPPTGLVTVVTGATFDLNNFDLTIGNLAGGGNVTLGTATLTIGDDTHETFGGVISGVGGSLVKQNSGSLTLTGANIYTGTTTVAGGSLLIDGSINGSLVTVSSGATLGGVGTISAPITNNGTLRPSTVSGTLTTSGPVIFNTGSDYVVELDPTQSNFLDVTVAGITINPGTTLTLMPNRGSYPRQTQIIYPIIQTATGVTGAFSSIEHAYPLLQALIIPSGNNLNLSIYWRPFTSLLGLSGNVGAVARSLDIARPAPGSDMDNIINELLFATSKEQLEDALNQMHPALYKGFALSQQNITVRMRSAITNRLRMSNQNICSLCKPIKEVEGDSKSTYEGPVLWINALGDWMNQKHNYQIGFEDASAGVILGFDREIIDNFRLGICSSYSFTNINWDTPSKGYIHSIYGSIYGSYIASPFYLNTVLTGAYNMYHGKRKMSFFSINRQANNDHEGGEASFHISLGSDFSWKNFAVNPYFSSDFIFLHENGFLERGADSLNLKVKSSHSYFLRTEAGVALKGCIAPATDKKLLPQVKFSVIREWRFAGKSYKTIITGANNVFTVVGLQPDRTLFAPGGSLTLYNSCGPKEAALSVSYDCEFGKRFWDQTAQLQFRYTF